MSEQIPAFPLRMPPEVRRWLTEEARKNERSLNNEIVHRFKQMAIAEKVVLK